MYKLSVSNSDRVLKKLITINKYTLLNLLMGLICWVDTFKQKIVTI
jgi:hypothetical protein